MAMARADMGNRHVVAVKSPKISGASGTASGLLVFGAAGLGAHIILAP
jgi:hypothetical protein